jgi:Uma2 family endonuclease
MATVQAPVEQRVVLHGVAWETYERLLADHESRSAPRFIYDDGELEIVSPMPAHERINRAVQLLAPLIARRLGKRVYSLGSTTFKREDMKRGFEPDGCFYFRNLEYVRGEDRLDATVDPAPDLIFEIDVTSGSIPRLPIYAAFGVPEVWRYRDERCQFLVLREASYVEVAESEALPGVTPAALVSILEESRWLDDVEWLDRAQGWVNELPLATRG